MADVEFHIDRKKLKKCALETDAAYQIVLKKRDEVQGRANAYSAGFKTEKTVNFKTHEKVGGSPARYGGNTKRFRDHDGVNVPVGIVTTENYAAMKDNHLHNTLLKSL